jgi:hypothetical protein
MVPAAHSCQNEINQKRGQKFAKKEGKKEGISDKILKERYIKTGNFSVFIQKTGNFSNFYEKGTSKQVTF